MNFITILLIICFNIFVFSCFFNRFVLVLLLTSQFSILCYWVIKVIKYFSKKKVQIKKIELDDTRKFDYYRTILREYSIGELGYLIHKKNNVDQLLAAELKHLKMKKCFVLKKNDIEFISDNHCNSVEKYIIENYQFINDKRFKKNYLETIELSLKEKSCLESYDFKMSFKMIVLFIFVLISFLIGWIIAGGQVEDATQNSLLFMFLEFIYFFIFYIVFSVMMYLVYWKKTIIRKTDTGKEIYWKLYNLKVFMKEFPHFSNEILNEISLFQEYVLYAMILDESKSLTHETREEFHQFVTIIEQQKK